MSTLSAREGYRLWAPSYETETAVSYLEDQIVAELGIQTSGRALLDVGCGTGRRLRESDAALAVGIDLATEMLRLASGSAMIAAADVRALPFADASFDVIWCRLVVGHVADIATAYAELSRVCGPGGVVIVSDLCPEAVAAGHRRTFRDAHGLVHEVEHFVHSTEAQVRAAGDVELSLETQRDGIVGASIESFYAPNRLEAYEAQRGLRLVHALSWRRNVRGVTRAARRSAERGRRATGVRDGVGS